MGGVVGKLAQLHDNQTLPVVGLRPGNNAS